MLQLTLHISPKIYTMDTTHYWPFSREYSIRDAAVTALQFSMADLEPYILSDATQWVYTAFFCSNSAHQLQNQPEEIIFSHFVTPLNGTFEWELAHEDKGYKSGSDSLNIANPLLRAPWLYHVSASENLSFNSATSPTW